MKKDWYSPHSIKYTKAQVKFLIPLLPLLRSGSYPPDPKETGYTDQGIRQQQFKPEAKFEIPASIAAELDLRIQRAGVDGLILEFLYAFEPEDELFVIEHIAQCLHFETKEVSQRIRNALYYVSGADRKTGSYSQYVKDNIKYLKLK